MPSVSSEKTTPKPMRGALKSSAGRPRPALRRVDVVVREQPDEVLGVLGGGDEIDEHEGEQRDADERRRRRRAPGAPLEHVVEEAADRDREARQRREDVVMELRDREGDEGVGRHEPDRAEPEEPLAAHGAHGPHDGVGERRGRERDPGERGVAELAQEVLEGAAIAVAAHDEPPPVVVAVELVPEPLAVQREHRVVPRHGDDGDAEQRDEDAVQELRAPQPLPVPGEAEVGEEHEHGQAEAGDALRERREPAQRRREEEVHGRLEAHPRREHEERDEGEEVGRHDGDAGDRDRARAHGEVPLELDRVDDELREGRDDEERHRAVEQAVVRPRQRPAPEPGRAPRELDVAVVEERERAEGEGHRHRPHEGHVRHGLARDEAVEREGRRDDAASTPARRLTKRETHR